MHKYMIGEYDLEHEATHEIEVHWPTHVAMPPLLLPAGSFICFQDQKEIPEELLGNWLIVEIRSYPDYRGDDISTLSYLVKRS